MSNFPPIRTTNAAGAPNRFYLYPNLTHHKFNVRQQVRAMFHGVPHNVVKGFQQPSFEDFTRMGIGGCPVGPSRMQYYGGPYRPNPMCQNGGQVGPSLMGRADGLVGPRSKFHGGGPVRSNATTPGKRPANNRDPPQTGIGNCPQNIQLQNDNISIGQKKKKLADVILPQKILDIVPESEAYMGLIRYEKKLDSIIMKKRYELQKTLQRPIKQKHKLRIYLSNAFYPAQKYGGYDLGDMATWELKIEGCLLKDSKREPDKIKKKFSTYFKSLMIVLDENLYGPYNHIVRWNHTSAIQDTDGFQIKRHGDKNVSCTIYLFLNYEPLQYKLDRSLSKILGIHTQTKANIADALWMYIKTHKLQDSCETQYINCDKYLKRIFNCSRMKFSEIPQRLQPLLYFPDPIIINHVIKVDGVQQNPAACYDIDVEVDDTVLITQIKNSFSTNEQEIQSFNNKIYEAVGKINSLKTSREFYFEFAKNPQQFIHKWIISQKNDLKKITDVVGNPEEERRAEFYYQPCIQEAVKRYISSKVQHTQEALHQQQDEEV